MDRDEFLHPENWQGGPTYQLAMAWPAGDDRQILSALAALWRAPGVSGPWNTPTEFSQRSAITTTLDRESGSKNYGLLTLENDTAAGCIVFTILKEKPASGTGLDWLFVAIYRGMQQRAFNFIYSDRFRHDNPWLEQIDKHYLAIAERVYITVPFVFAIINFEGPASFDGSQDSLAEIQRYGSGCLLPNNEIWRWRTAGWIERASGLRWLPPRGD